MFERADHHYTSVDSGLICNMKSAYKSAKTMQGAAPKEKQDAKAMYSIPDNSKTVRSLVNTNNEQIDPDKSEHEKILSRAYSANTITTAKNLTYIVFINNNYSDITNNYKDNSST